MDRIQYAGGTLLTGSDIAAALLAYAEALAKRESSARIEIPVRTDEGTVVRATMLLGPASQLVSQYEPSSHEELIDTELVAELLADAARIGPTRAVIDVDGDELQPDLSFIDEPPVPDPGPARPE